MIHVQRRTTLALAAGLFATPFVARAQIRTVVDTMAGDPRFTRFLELVGRAGLVDTLRGPGPYTVFAPTDAAFAAAPAQAIEAIAEQGTGGGGGSGGGTLSGASPDRVRLQAFVQYHIVSGQAWNLAALVGPDRTLRTENGSSVVVSAQPGQVVTIRNPTPGQGPGFGAAGINVMPPAQFVQTDIPASNGIVHAIGGVLFP